MIGLAPRENLPDKCRQCNTDLLLDRGHGHAHVCHCVKSHITMRHDTLVNALATKVARRAGIYAKVEPRMPTEKKPKARADLRLSTSLHGIVYVDVSLVHTNTAGRLGSNQPGSTSVAQRERDKINTYQRAALAEGAKFEPFVLDTYGRFGAAARRVLAILAKEAEVNIPGMTAKAFVKEATDIILQDMHKGNAALLLAFTRSQN